MTELPPLLDVTAVRVLARYLVELTFAEGTERVVDLEAMLRGPVFKPLLTDYELHGRVNVDRAHGTSCGRTERTSPPERCTSDQSPRRLPTITDDGAHS